MNRYAYKRAADARYSGGVSAQTIGEELTRIWTANGQKLLPRDLVQEARPAGAALHRCFEWDDAVAGEAFRLQQARILIRAIRVETDQGPQNLFVHVKVESKETKPFYQSTLVIAERPIEYMAALAEARQKLREASESFDELRRLAGGERRDDSELAKLTAIAEALATASQVAARLQ